MGHAIGVYLYGKTLPEAVAPRGFLYRPGKSSPASAVSYQWEAVLIARSGGADGNGGVLYVGEDDVCPDGCPPAPPPEEIDPECEGDDCMIDPDCEEFLNPAAERARALADDVEPRRFAGPGATGAALDRHVRIFTAALGEAMALEDLDEDTDHSEVESIKDDVQADGLCEHSPLVVDLDGDGIELGDVRGGPRFDLQGRGSQVRVSWPTGGDAFLVRDRDHDGTIGSGAELFGQAWQPDGFRHGDGFAALAALDANADGAIDAADPAFGELRLWVDADGDAITGDRELVSLVAAGLGRLGLDPVRSDARDRHGNALALHARFDRTDGTSGALVDAWLRIARR
jgi:hypothetical protein